MPLPRPDKQTIFRSAAALGLPRLTQRALFRGELAILMYHGLVRDPLPIPDWCFVSEADFAGQMQYLRRHVQVLSLGAALERLHAGEITRPTVAITFDDGFRSVHDLAAPILRRLELPATVFLSTGFLDRPGTIWFCRLLQALGLARGQALRWRGREYDLRGTAARTATSARLQDELKALPHDEMLAAVEEIAEALGVERAALEAVDPRYRFMTTPQVRALAASGLVEFGAHTVNHTILTRVSPERARLEIAGSVEEAERLLDRPVRLFAYPNGRARDYDDTALALLRLAGIEAAVTTRRGPNTRETPPLELRRYGVGAEMSLDRFQWTVHHLLSRLQRSG